MAIALEIYEALRSVGVADAKAKSTAEKFDQALDARFQHEHKILATREDLTRETGLLREDLAGARGEVASIREQMATREDLAKLESRLIRWNVGTMIAVAGLTLAIVKLIG